ncbi:MAG: c-type cytochrome [Acidobacteriota bacterium]
MKQITLLALVLFAALSLVACGGNAPAASTGAQTAPKAAGDADKGKSKYEGTCSACHGPDAKGLTGLGKDLTSSTFAKGLSDADLIAFVKKGRPASDPANTTKVDMPPKGGNPALTDQDLADVVTYVRSLQK